MRADYEAAARYGTAYYGQLARARLGLDRIELRSPLQPDPSNGPALSDELVRAADMLYELGERDVVRNFVADLAEQSADVAALVALGELTARRNDAPAMLQIGKTALARGLALDLYAFPTIGVPQHSPVGPEIDRSVVYSVARTESAFDQRDTSPAKAVGLMQVTPAAGGRDTAKRFGVTYDWDRMVSDPVYNTQMGAAELSALLREYRGCHIMTFRRLQRRPRPRPAMGETVWRSTRSQGRCDRLGGTHSICRDAKLRPAGHGEFAGLSCPFWHRHSCDIEPRSASARTTREATALPPVPVAPSSSER